MYIKFLCWVYGHKIMVKAFTGNKIDTNMGYYTEDMLLYKWQREPRCIRCGKEVK